MSLITYDALQAAVTQVPSGGSRPNLTEAYYDRRLLAKAQRKLIHDRYGQQRPLPQKNGKTIMFRRYTKFSQNITPLGTGNPTGHQMAYTDIQATVEIYGDFVWLSDEIDMFFIDNASNEASDLCSIQMGESMDSVCRDVINAGTSVWRSTADGNSPTYGSGARSTVNACLTKKVCDAAITALHAEDAEYPLARIGATSKIATEPVGESFVAITHPHVAHDMVQTASGFGDDFTPTEKYASYEGLLPGEFGKYRNIRFCMTTNAKVWADSGGGTGAGTTYRSTSGSAVDVYSVLIIAKDAYGVVPLAGYASKLIRKPLGSAGTADALDRFATVGWKAVRTAVILNDAWMTRIEVAALI